MFDQIINIAVREVPARCRGGASRRPQTPEHGVARRASASNAPTWGMQVSTADAMTRSCLAFLIYVMLSAGAVAANTETDWPIYHGDAGLRGIASCKLPDKFSVLWRYKVGSAVSLAPVSDGKNIFFVAENGEASAITLSGEKVWLSTITQEQAATNVYQHKERYQSPPAVVRNMVLIGSDIGRLHALKADSGETKWKYQVGESITATVNWIEPGGSDAVKVVVISQADSVLHCVDLDSGRSIWTTQPLGRSDGSPGIGKGFVSFGNCESALYVYSSSNGHLAGCIKLNESDGQVVGGVSVAGDLLFAGTRGGLAVCADVRKAAIVWTNQLSSSESFATPAVADEKVVTCSNDGSVYCLNRIDGKLMWNVKVSGEPRSPIIAGDKVVIASGGTLYILKLQDGTILWSDKSCDTLSPPAVLDGRIVVGTDDGFVVMYGAVK